MFVIIKIVSSLCVSPANKTCAWRNHQRWILCQWLPDALLRQCLAIWWRGWVYTQILFNSQNLVWFRVFLYVLFMYYFYVLFIYVNIVQSLQHEVTQHNTKKIQAAPHRVHRSHHNTKWAQYSFHEISDQIKHWIYDSQYPVLHTLSSLVGYLSLLHCVIFISRRSRPYHSFPPTGHLNLSSSFDSEVFGSNLWQGFLLSEPGIDTSARRASLPPPLCAIFGFRQGPAQSLWSRSQSRGPGSPGSCLWTGRMDARSCCPSLSACLKSKRKNTQMQIWAYSP